MNKQTEKCKLKGFTLIEVIIVIAIIGILSAMLIPNFLAYLERARNRADVTAASVICKDIQMECVMEPEKIELFIQSPWKEGVNADASAYDADDHGYVYVDKKEVRVSSYELAKMLEENGYIDSAGPNVGDIAEYRYSKKECEKLICKSNRKWYRYQINIAYRDGEFYFTYSANSKKGEKKNVSGQSQNSNLHDQRASEIFANMIGGIADDVVSLPPVN